MKFIYILVTFVGYDQLWNLGIKEGKPDNCYFGELYYFGWGD
jgi:hypothetical protein